MRCTPEMHLPSPPIVPMNYKNMIALTNRDGLIDKEAYDSKR